MVATVNILGTDDGICEDKNETFDKSSDDQTKKANEDESGYYDDDDRILRDNNKLISSMKFDDIKLETYDRVFNRSFTNPIGYKFNGKSLTSIP